MIVNDTDALIVVNVQNDLCQGGARPVPGAENIVRLLNQLIIKFDTVIYTRLWHTADDLIFDENHYCVEHSPGAEFHGNLRVPLDAKVVDWIEEPEDGTHPFQNEAVQALLHKRKIQRIFVAGLPLDSHVKLAAMGASTQYLTLLIVDACRGYAQDGNQAAMEAMKAAGVAIVSSGVVQ